MADALISGVCGPREPVGVPGTMPDRIRKNNLH